MLAAFTHGMYKKERRLLSLQGLLPCGCFPALHLAGTLADCALQKEAFQGSATSNCVFTHRGRLFA